MVASTIIIIILLSSPRHHASAQADTSKNPKNTDGQLPELSEPNLLPPLVNKQKKAQFTLHLTAAPPPTLLLIIHLGEHMQAQQMHRC